MVIIDAYTHYAPPRLMSFLSKHSTDGKAPFSDLFSKIPALTDLDVARIKLMDDKGVDTHVLVPLPWIDPVRKVAENEELALEACRICNEEVSVKPRGETTRIDNSLLTPTRYCRWRLRYRSIRRVLSA